MTAYTVTTSGDITVLHLTESQAANSTVHLDLAKGEETSQPGTYAGSMTLNEPNDPTNNGKVINTIEADFVGGTGGSGGHVNAEIRLADGNNYSSPIMNSNLPSNVFVALKDNTTNTAVMTFTDPDSDAAPTPTELFFNTAEGIIDPGVSVHRIPPQ